jgi:hypothetical protein
MRKIFSLPSILPNRLGLPGRHAVAYGVFLFLTLTCYMALTQGVKSWLLKKAWA